MRSDIFYFQSQDNIPNSDIDIYLHRQNMNVILSARNLEELKKFKNENCSKGWYGILPPGSIKMSY